MRLCPFCGNEAREPDWRCPKCDRSPERVEGYFRLAPQFAEETAGFDPAFFAQLFRFETGSFWFQGRSAAIEWALRRYFGSPRNLLEIGCGTGYVLSCLRRTFPGVQLSGSEVLSAALPFAGSRLSEVELFQMDARRVPFDREFDVVCAFDVLEHIAEDRDVLAQMFRAVKAGGGIMLTVPQHPWLWSRTDEYAHHLRRYRRNELIEKVRSAGFSVVRVTSFVSLLVPLMIASRVLDSLRSKDLDPTGEFRLPSWLNAILRQCLRAELRLIEMGVSFPIGGSLLLVARRPVAGVAHV